MLKELGFYLGGDLNEAHDNLWYTVLFKHPELLDCSDEDLQARLCIFEMAMRGGRSFSDTQVRLLSLIAARRSRDYEALRSNEYQAAWVDLRIRSMLERGTSLELSQKWGWKEPNTHVLFDRLNRFIPGLRYIHVVRNGLDMAYSANQNQVRLWGPVFLGEEFHAVTPRLSLRYWRLVHERILRLRALAPGPFLLLNYDLLFTNTQIELPKLLEFLDIPDSQSLVAELSAHIRPPTSIGRFRLHEPSDFDAGDVAFVRSLGFETT